jgi:large subunit ribosomal protein L24
VAHKIRSGDNVQVISGKDAGKRGKVLRVEPRRNRLFVEGLNMVKRHQRPTSLKDTQRGGQTLGGVIEKEGPIHISNVMILDPKDDRPTRVGIERGGEAGRERVTRRSNTKLTT